MSDSPQSTAPHAVKNDFLPVTVFLKKDYSSGFIDLIAVCIKT